MRNDGWITVSLGDIAENISERVKTVSESGFERWVSLSHIDYGAFRVTRWGEISEATSSGKIFRAGDILLPRRFARSKTAQEERRASEVDFEGVCSGDAYVLREKPDTMVPGLLKFILNTNRFWEYAIANADGSMSTRVKWKNLENYSFEIHPQLNTVIATLESCKTLIGQFGRITAELRRSSNLVRNQFFRDLMNDDSVPKVRMEELLSSPIRNGAFVRSKDLGSGFPFVNVTDIYSGFTVDFSSLDLAPASDKELLEDSVFKGDIIFNRSSLVLEGIGHNCYVDKDVENAFFECHLMRVRLDSSKVNPKFVARYCLSNPGREHILSRAKTTTMTTISQPDLREMLIPIPESKIQDNVSDKMDSLDSIIEKFDKTKSSLELTMLAIIESKMGA